MTSKKEHSESDDETEEPKGGRPGPTDEGGTGGMATREVAPEIVHNDKKKD